MRIEPTNGRTLQIEHRKPFLPPRQDDAALKDTWQGIDMLKYLICLLLTCPSEVNHREVVLLCMRCDLIEEILLLIAPIGESVWMSHEINVSRC